VEGRRVEAHTGLIKKGYIMQELNLKLEWDTDHYDVYILELGQDIQATGKTQNEALANASVVISRYQSTQTGNQEKKTA